MSATNGNAAPVILILEDEAMILLEMSFAIEDHGAEAIQAPSVRSALEAIEKARPDAAILDVNLGRNTTCEAVATRLGELNVPFVLHSGDLVRQGELIARIGAEVIPKPSSSDHVASRAIALARETRET
ncbi:response regulator receiver domain-containing protein [Palleronia aestuarii]|uniref:Response regulator receiver domain-containing protein n=1 Tax=Palleronia aestuarii TaxID=568105 RepID=A0A2W7NCZ8_9RHOB|nr:response regulator [Palleronia aestuarii]PZX18261.1 response regulator receiver domain-containing protein [Palleronia aestuarii]